MHQLLVKCCVRYQLAVLAGSGSMPLSQSLHIGVYYKLLPGKVQKEIRHIMLQKMCVKYYNSTWHG